GRPFLDADLPECPAVHALPRVVLLLQPLAESAHDDRVVMPRLGLTGVPGIPHHEPAVRPDDEAPGIGVRVAGALAPLRDARQEAGRTVALGGPGLEREREGLL